MNTIINSNIRELLQTNGNCMTIDSTKTTINKTLSQIKRYQERVRRHIEDNYVDFMRNHTSSDLYIVDGETLLREAENLIKSVGSDAQSSLNEANDELAHCTNELREATLGMQITYRILKIDDLFQCVEEANTTKEYIVVLDVLEKLKDLIFPPTTNVNNKDDVVMRVFLKCACYKAIKIKYHIQEHILQQNLTQRFERLLQFSEKSFPNSKLVTIKVTKDVNQLQDTVMALFQSHYKPTKLCDFLMWNCFEPILKKPVSLECTEDSEFMQLQLSYSLKDLGNRLRPSYKQVFEQTRILLNALNSINVSVSQDKHVLTIVGEHINKTLLPMIVDECLMYAIPETMDDYQQSTLVEDVIQFEQHLADTFLINLEINRNLTYFCERFELYFKEYFLKKLLESAKEIMQKDLQDMTMVADKNTAEDVANNPLLFPRCMISKSTLDFVKLMERILRQTIDTECGDKETKFVDAIAQMLNAYVIEMPEIHKKLMESIPQQSVIFYNNCMFLAHWLAENPQKGIPTLPALEKLLQTTGTKYLKMQIAKQQKIVMDILKEFDVSSTHTIGAMPIKLIRQCLRQLDLLKNVWQNVLPESLYNSTFCDILNDFAIELMRRILAMEDISATVANELSELLALILEKAPQLFREEHTVVQIKSWMRLQHLKIILNASLHEITEQWCEGAGILTATFKAEEIRHLIRALFQNTDRRAKALSKII